MKELTFWQAYWKTAAIMLRAVLAMGGLFSVGVAAAYLLTSGHWVLTVLLLAGVLAVWLGFAARSLQRWSRW